MANLLPLLEKKKIQKEYKMRFCIVSVFLFVIFTIISMVLLSPSFILSSFKYNNATMQLEIEKKKISDAAEGVDPIKIAKEVNAQLKILKQYGYFMPPAYDVFTVIEKHKPSNVKIRSMFYDRRQKDGDILIGGVSKDRKTLLSFLKSLEEDNMFTNVELPISSFVEGKDIDFSIKIKINREDKNITKKKNEEK